MSHSVEPHDSREEDLRLIRQCQQGDSSAFDALVLRYQQQAFAVALRMLGDAEDAKEVAQALETLDEDSRMVVVLRDIQGLSYEEIAQVLRCRIGTVKSRLNRARLRLRALLDGTLY